jgi:hypothetical protein
MATTIKGGAYLSADGKTFHDASGKKINPPAPIQPLETKEQIKKRHVRRPSARLAKAEEFTTTSPVEVVE